MPLGSESSSVQRPFIRYALAAGWTYLSPEEALARRSGGVTSPVPDAVLGPQLIKLNPKVLDAAKAGEVIKGLVRVRPSIEGNLDAWEFLKGLKTVFVEAEKRERNVRFLDPANVAANEFHVTEEFTFSNGVAPDMWADLVFFINGVPVLIVSTIQKFEEMPADINTRPNIFVLVDEAHRTTGGDLGNYLMGALPKATFLGFTGTPIDQTAKGKGTFKVFGFEDEKGYLDKYSIKESILDGTTVPLHYALAPNELRVDRETLEREFLNLTAAEGVSDFEALNKILEQAVNLRNMLKNRDRVEKVAAYAAKQSITARTSSPWATRRSSWRWTAKRAASTRKRSTSIYRRSGHRSSSARPAR